MPGFKVRVVSVGGAGLHGKTVNVAVCTNTGLTPVYVAVMVKVVEIVTVEVVIVNDALDAPGAILTLGGTAAPSWPLVESWIAPPAAGAEESVTAPALVPPATRLVGETEKVKLGAADGAVVRDPSGPQWINHSMSATASTARPRL